MKRWILLGTFILPLVLNAGNIWVQQSPASTPEARWDPGIAAVTDDRAVMINGFDSGDSPMAEIWSWNTGSSAWTKIFDGVSDNITATGATAAAALTSGSVLAFGGEYSGGAFSDSTWIIGFDGSGWTFSRLDVSPRPSARKGAQIARLSDGMLLLFGGFNNSYLSDTWLYETGSGWTQLNPLSSPSGRNDAMMSRIGNNQVVLYGGYNGTVKSDMWIFELDYGWSILSPDGAPGGAANGDMAYLGGDRVMMKTELGTHVYDLSDNIWISEIHAAPANAVWDFAMDNVDGKVVLFGGFDIGETLLDETWLYGSDQSLPVTLSSFTAVPVKNGIMLNWETSAEIENAGFVIRRQEAGDRNQEEIPASYLTDDALRGQGTVTSQTEYRWTDTRVKAGTSYIYTLSDIDLSGTETRHDDLAVTATAASSELVNADHYTLGRAYPNPFNPSFNVPFTLIEHMQVTVTLHDITGRPVRTIISGNLDAGTYEEIVSMPGHPSGIYFLRMQMGADMHAQKIVLMK